MSVGQFPSRKKLASTICKVPAFNNLPPVGRIAQLVEQRTENPCVTSSNLVLATLKSPVFQ